MPPVKFGPWSAQYQLNMASELTIYPRLKGKLVLMYVQGCIPHLLRVDLMLLKSY